MATLETTTYPVRSQVDVIGARQAVRLAAVAQGFSLVDQTKIVTAASELARNALVHGGGGSLILERLQDGPQAGLRLTFEDQGPGIPDIARALTDGFTTGNGLGLGLGGSRRLVNEFQIESAPGRGTRVTVTRWR